MTDTEIAPTGSASTDETVSGDVLLHLENVDKRYPGVHALKDVTLTVRAGEIHALVGENGAGKSTLVGVAAGAVTPDSGIVSIGGERNSSPTPEWSRENGLAIVYQEPALLPDLTVAENMRLSMPAAKRPRARDQVAWAGGVLENWKNLAAIDPAEPVRNLPPDARFVVEIARAMAEDPKVIILDEPTEHLLPGAVTELFRLIDLVVERGGAVVYISHKIHEVKQIATTISVLRDGTLETTRRAGELSEQDIINYVVGHDNVREAHAPSNVDHTAPAKLEVTSLSGDNFSDVTFSVQPGEIVGFAGIDGQGQRDALRALAGLVRSQGEVTVGGKKVSTSTAARVLSGGIAYVPHDRHREGIFEGLSLRENASTGLITKIARGGFIPGRRERARTVSQFSALRVKAASADVHIENLSGGNQQKVVLSRILLSGAEVILADEPTQGVDVGARGEIYEILRAEAAKGAAIIVLSSSAVELEELCNRVFVFSRGAVAAELSGEQVSERQITSAALTSTTQRASVQRSAERAPRTRTLSRIFDSDYLPGGVLLVAILALGAVATAHSPFYLTTRNFGLMLPLLTILVFFALAQQLVMMVGGIDLSVGPLSGLLVVVGSYVIPSNSTPFGVVVGIAIIVVVAAVVGLINWCLTTVVGITPLIATLVTFTGLGGIAFLLRPVPGGQISKMFTGAITTPIVFIPIIFIAAVVIALALEFMLRRTLLGVRLRGVGSNEVYAEKVGVRRKRMLLVAYVGCSLLVVPASFLLMAQAGSGNASIGDSYTLSSIGAVVLGGASIFGGRGSFIGAMLGAFLVIQINTVVQFLGLPPEWQLWFVGGLTIIAAAFYSTMRTRFARGTLS